MSRPLVIGQCLNAAGSRSVAQALARRDACVITDVARRQAEAGADYLDLCAAGTDDEPGALCWLVHTVQDAIDVPLSLDTHNTEALRRALPLCRRLPLINSLSANQTEETWALLRDWTQCPVVALCLGERGVTATAGQRLKAAARLADRLAACGVPPERLIFDPLTLPAREGRGAQDTTLQAMTLLRERFPTSGVLCAVGNSGFGLTGPLRRTVERSFAGMALGAGADAFLCDPRAFTAPPGPFCAGRSR